MRIPHPRLAMAAAVGLSLAAVLSGCGRKAIHYEGSREQILEQATALVDNWRGDGRELEEAQGRLRQLLAANPQDAPALVQMARVSCRSGFYSGDKYDPASLAEAGRLLDQAEVIAPNLYELWVVRGWVKIFEKDYSAAMMMAEKAVQLGPGNPRTFFLRASILKHQERFEEALATAQESLSLSRTPYERTMALDILAPLYEEVGRPDESRKTFETQIQEDPGSAWAKSNYAQFLIRQKDYDKAISYAEQALAQMDYGNAHWTLGQAYYWKAEELWQKKDYMAAGPLLEKSVKADPDDADAWYLLGWYYREAARQQRSTELLDKSGDAFEKALDVDPNHAGAKKELAEHRKYRSRFN